MASTITASKVSGVDDIIDQGRFLLLFGQIPGGPNTFSLTLRCNSAVISGTNSEVMEVPMHGYTLRFRGRKLQSSPLSVSFWEDSKLSAYSMLWDWMEYVTDSETNNSGGYLLDYSTTIQQSMFDTKGIEAGRFQYDYAFPQDITDISLTVENSAAMQIQLAIAFRQKRKVSVGGADVSSQSN